MTPDRWQQIERIYHSALELAENERPAFLEKACAGDEALRQEVESLLQSEQSGERFIEEPALEVAAKMMAREKPESLLGQQLGSYQILSLLGTGGMGVVYKAQDTRLKRFVAVKVLPAEQVSDPERKRRFIQEARAASALNHPNIITIYDIGNEGGIDFVVMEYVAGKTLDQRIPRKGMRLDETLKIALQMVDALAKAHSAGIIHRDLKPTNVMVTDDGLVKVLDFGLAKLTEVVSDEGGTRTTQLQTEEGAIVGTVSFMSPEQARGEALDVRTDLFSLGVVLYEMATGMLPFKGNTPAAIFSAILSQSPVPPVQLNPKLPSELERIINKALEKDREVRCQTASDLRADLKRLQRDTDVQPVTSLPVTNTSLVPEPSTRRFRPQKSLAIVATLVVLLVILGRVWYGWRELKPKPQLAVRQRQLTTNPSETPVTAAAISPDGRYLAFADDDGIYLRLIDTGERHSLTIPAGLKVFHLAWFPDGTKLLASGVGEKSEVSAVWKVSILGGRPVKVRDDVQLASVSPDGLQIAFVGGRGREIWLMGEDGEELRRLLPGDGNSVFRCLIWFPDGQRVAYVRDPLKNNRVDVESCDLKGASIRQILSNLSVDDLSVLPDGELMYATARSPWTSSGDSEADLQPLKQSEGSLWEIRTDMRTGSADGRSRRIISWPGFMVSNLSASRDGKRLILAKKSDNTEIYVGELEENGRRMKPPMRLTFDDHYDSPGDWTPDSKAIVFSSDRNGNSDIFKQVLDQRSAEPIVAGPGDEFDPTVTPDGSSILYFTLFTGDRRASTHPVSMRRAPIAGGTSLLVLSEKGFSSIHCARQPSNLCVVDQRTQKQLVFYAFDPSKGKGRELARIDLQSAVDDYSWSLSPDGSRIAVMYGEQKDLIRILALDGWASSEVKVDGWAEVAVGAWAADGKGWFVSANSVRSEALLYVDLNGHAQVVWQQPSHSGIWGIPSPDGRYLAFPATATASNAWLIENF